MISLSLFVVTHSGRHLRQEKVLGRVLIGINRFWFDGLVGFFRVLLEKKLVSVGLVDQLFNQPPTRLQRLKKYLRDYIA